MCGAALPIGCTTSDPMISVDTLRPASLNYARSRIGNRTYPIPGYARLLDGVRICLDPGHGGDAHKRGFKRGPTGVREAEINLRVAQYLRDFLESVGAEVKLTRESDVDLSHADRAAVATAWNADLFVSVHHNAIANKPEVNYTTVWYHGVVDDRPANLDLARYLSDGLHDHLPLDRVVGVPLKSDQLMYADGFAVLRHARVTAALTESTFYTNPEEEQRLRQPRYNLQEAYALFIGFAKYAAAGLPRAKLVAPDDGVVQANSRMLSFELDDGLRSRGDWGSERQMILSDTIAVYVGSRRLAHTFTNEDYRLRVTLPADLAPGPQQVRVHFQNMNKNSNLNPFFTVELQP